jgi:hypothetical protein
MSEKVVITKEQAEAIENLEPETPKSSIVKAHLNHKGMWGSDMSPLNALHADKLIQALYIGYEVEPEFNVGDWITDTITGKVAKIDHRGVSESQAWVDDDTFNFFENFRHATPGEIAAEKERRWWSKHGRDVWELREKDMLIDSHGNVHEVTGVPHDLDSRYYLDYVAINFDEIKGKYSVLVFAENRLDINHD